MMILSSIVSRTAIFSPQTNLLTNQIKLVMIKSIEHMDIQIQVRTLSKTHSKTHSIFILSSISNRWDTKMVIKKRNRANYYQVKKIHSIAKILFLQFTIKEEEIFQTPLKSSIVCRNSKIYLKRNLPWSQLIKSRKILDQMEIQFQAKTFSKKKILILKSISPKTWFRQMVIKNMSKWYHKVEIS